jgi:hypothetical protein
MAAVAVQFQRAAALLVVGAALVALAAVFLVSPAVRAMEEGCGSSVLGMGSDLAMTGIGGTLPRVQGIPTLDVEQFILQDNEFREEHTMNMEVCASVNLHMPASGHLSNLHMFKNMYAKLVVLFVCSGLMMCIVLSRSGWTT